MKWTTKEEIKAAVKIVDYALLNGYTIDKEKSSVNWVKLENTTTGDKILANTKQNMYTNLEYENDKGDILKFVANRIDGFVSTDNSKEAFYNALKKLNEFLGNYVTGSYKKQLEDKDKFFSKKEKLTQLQSREWNHEPITDYSYLTNQRQIDINTLKLPLFKDRLFNTYFITEGGHFIKNFAFGKYTAEHLVGLEVRNATLKSILGDHDGVFYTNTKNMDKIDGLFYAESGIDVLSYVELLYANPTFDATKNYCFLSFAGNLYESKLNKIIDDILKLPITNETKFVSLTDNDLDKEESKKNGKNYDLMFTAALLNQFYTPVEYATDPTFYKYFFSNGDDLDWNKIKSVVEEQNNFIDTAYGSNERYGKYVMIKEVENTRAILFPKSIPLSQTHFIDILKTIQAERLYIPHKPKNSKDWNEELIKKKNNSMNHEKKKGITHN